MDPVREGWQRFSAETECEFCRGTGLAYTPNVRDGAALVCRDCQGTGRRVIVIDFRRWRGRQERTDVNRVYAVAVGHVVDDETDGGVSIEEWRADPDSVYRRGNEIRSMYCPAWWNNELDRREPDWPECRLALRFPLCSKFRVREQCWERYDAEQDEDICQNG